MAHCGKSMQGHNSTIIKMLRSFFKFFILSFKDFIYLCLERGREGETDRNINMWLPLMHPH